MKIFLLSVFILFCYGLSDNETDESCPETLVNTKIWPTPYVFTRNKTEDYLVFELDNSSDAKCLDGSNYKFLFQNGSGSGAKKFMFYFSGGGYCSYENKDFLDSCNERSKGYSGSSSSFGSTFSTTDSYGYFSSDEYLNPLFANWNKVQFPYCDGIFFQGYVKDPVAFVDPETNTTNYLWFRGYNITKSTLEYLRDYLGLFDAEELIVTGVSSGGQAAMMWLPYIRNFLPAHIKISAISDASLFLDIQNQNNGCYNFRRAIKKIVNFTNSYYLDIFENCTFRSNISEFWKCLVPEYILEYLDERFLIVNSQNDFEIMRGPYGLHCLDYGLGNCFPNVSEQISNYRQQILRFAMKIKEKKPTWGFWLRKCLEHYYAQSTAWTDFYVFSADTYKVANLRDVVYEWYLSEKGPIYIDLEDWNADCPAIKDENGLWYR